MKWQSKQFSGTVKRIFTSIFTAWFCCVAITSHPVLAQTSTTDFESPIVEHEVLPSGSWGENQIFEAAVVDNDAVKRVLLFYRFAGDLEYTEVQMQQLASSSSYTASIETNIESEAPDAIEYYIRAEDASDNLVLKGFSFEPLVRILVSEIPEVANSVESEMTIPADSKPVQIQKKSGVNWLYVALGVLLVGGIAGAAGGGSGSGSPTTVGGDCDPNCTVTFAVPTP